MTSSIIISEDSEKMHHDEDFNRAIGCKIVDILSNLSGEYEIILDNNYKIHFSYSEYGNVELIKILSKDEENELLESLQIQKQLQFFMRT